MDYRKKIKIISSLSFVGLGVGYIIAEPLKFGICKNTYVYGNEYEYIGCFDKTATSIGEPLFLTSLSLFLVFLILFFTKEAIFNSWKKFGIWYIPLSALLIFLALPGPSGGFGYSMSFDRESVTIFLSVLFLIISLIIIMIKSWKLRGRG